MIEPTQASTGLPLAIVDVAVIAVAERPQLTEITTLDHWHFVAVRPGHTWAFTLLPSSDL